MKIFEFEIQEFLSRTVDIEAKNEGEAYQKIKEMYQNEKIILGSSDYVKTEIKLTTSIDDENYKNNLISDIIEYLYKDEKKHLEEFGNEKPSDHIFLKLQKLKRLI